VECDFLAGEERVDEGVVLFARQRTIDVIGAGACGPDLVVARLEPGNTEVDRVAVHDRRDGIEKGQRCFAGERADRVASAGEVSGPVAMMTLSQSGGGARISSRRMSMSGSCSSAAVIAAAKPSRSTASAPPAGSLWASAARITSDPSRRISACRRPMALPCASSERNEFEQTSSAKSPSCARRSSDRPHFVQHHRHAAARDLPRSLGTRKTAADDMDRLEVGRRRELIMASK
jgi:hypothetical protein